MFPSLHIADPATPTKVLDAINSTANLAAKVWFIRPTAENMTRPEYALKYSDCSIQELKRFARHRYIAIPPVPYQYNLLFHYADTMRKADQHATFRFFDLPAELRNVVYLELLTLRPPNTADHVKHAGGFCWPAILASCRLASVEACDVVFAENTIEIALVLELASDSQEVYDNGPCKLTVNGLPVDTAQMHQRLYDGPVEWPCFLMKAKSVKITIQIDNTHVDAAKPWPGSFPDHLLVWSRVLYDLQSYLEGSDTLSRVEVAFEAEPRVEIPEETLAQALWPLTLFGDLVHANAVPKSILEHLNWDVAKSSVIDSHRSLLKNYRYLVTKVQSYSQKKRSKTTAKTALRRSIEYVKAILHEGYIEDDFLRLMISSDKLHRLTDAVNSLEEAVKHRLARKPKKLDL